MSAASEGRRGPFFQREKDGTVRIRMKFFPIEVALIEEAAGAGDPVEWLYKTIRSAAEREAQEARSQRTIAPPQEQA